MSNTTSDGVIRVGRKGRKKFAIGEEGKPFEVDVVVAFQEWVCIDQSFRENNEDGYVPVADMQRYHQEAVNFVTRLAAATCEGGITTAEALDFIARLREQYDELAAFFRPKLRDEPDSADTSVSALQFSEEPAAEAS